MPGVYRGADLLLVTSFREGHSLAVLEAMACGLPVVAFDIPSIREQITHAEGGLLVPYGDLAALSRAVVELSEDAAMCVEMGRRNRERAVADFTVERMVQDYRDLFHSVC
jgi:glycosyltransferase involved in cell wall biosynthesis